MTALLLPTSDVMVQAVWFALAIALVDSFDISLPRGDSFSVSGALIASGALVLAPGGLVLMSVAGLLGLLFAYGVRRTLDSPSVNGPAPVVRTFAILSLWALVFILESSPFVVGPVLTGCLAAALYLGVELFAAQAILAYSARRPLGRLLTGNIRRQTPIIAAQVSVTALVLIAYPAMSAWSLVPVTAMLLLIRQSYAMLLQMRETYRSTVEVLAEVAEGQDARLAGHAERTAHITRSICSRLGMTSHQVEQASYAALLHGLDSIGEESRSPEGQTGGSSGLLEGVVFLSDIVPILQICDGVRCSDGVKESELLMAMSVALACEIDVLQQRQIAAAHSVTSLSRVAACVDGSIKAKVVAAALQLGYETPAVN